MSYGETVPHPAHTPRRVDKPDRAIVYLRLHPAMKAQAKREATANGLTLTGWIIHELTKRLPKPV